MENFPTKLKKNAHNTFHFREYYYMINRGLNYLVFKNDFLFSLFFIFARYYYSRVIFRFVKENSE